IERIGHFDFMHRSLGMAPFDQLLDVKSQWILLVFGNHFVLFFLIRAHLKLPLWNTNQCHADRIHKVFSFGACLFSPRPRPKNPQHGNKDDGSHNQARGQHAPAVTHSWYSLALRVSVEGRARTWLGHLSLSFARGLWRVGLRRYRPWPFGLEVPFE